MIGAPIKKAWYAFSEIENPLNTSCPISLEPFTPNQVITQIHHCGHIFNSSSIQEWFRNHVRCPVCRYDIRDNNNNNNTTTASENENENENEEEENINNIIPTTDPRTPRTRTARRNDMMLNLMYDLLNIDSSYNYPDISNNNIYYYYRF
jgi:hypothetical protein